MATIPQTPVAIELRRARRLITEMRVPWALIGGLAVSVRAEPRFTRDVDWRQARTAVALIRARGFHRSRDLTRALRRWER